MSYEAITRDGLLALMQDLVDVREGSLGLEVELPVVYPTGETVVVTVAFEGEAYNVHDSGNGAAALSAYGLSITDNLAKRLVEIAAHYGCEFLDGRMTRRAQHTELPVAVAIVANASRSIADQLLAPRGAPIVDFKTEALQVLRESVGARRIRENERLLGASGFPYTASAVILSEDESQSLGLVEPIRDHEAATKKFREFWDIKENADLKRLERIALYDDRRQWSAPDLNLLQRVCNVVRLSDGVRRMQELMA